MFILFCRSKERLCLVLLGIIFISFAAGLAAATATTTQGTVDEKLAKHWRTDYDLLVRHPDSVSEIELSEGIISNRFQSNNFDELYITWSQLETIRSIEGVEVAAPLAIVGPAFTENLGVSLDYNKLEPGIYKEEILVTRDNGIEEITTKYTRYFNINDDLIDKHGEAADFIVRFSRAGFTIPPFEFYPSEYTVNIIAVDFEAESQLYGLERALVEGTLPKDAVVENDIDNLTTFPVVMNKNFIFDGQAVVSISKLTDIEPSWTFMEELSTTEKNILANSRKKPVMEFELNINDLFVPPDIGSRIAHSYTRAPGPLEYQYLDGNISVIADNLGRTFGLVTGNQNIHGAFQTKGRNQIFRTVIGQGMSAGTRRGGTYAFNYYGMFDPEKLTLQPLDSPIAAPMEIYRPVEERVLQGIEGADMSEAFAKSLHPYDFIGSPVGGLIPIDSIRHLHGDAHISSVRVKVSGVDEMDEDSQLRVAYIAKQIEELTGLHVDIVLGSSNQRRPIYLYSYDNSQRQAYHENVKSVLAGVDEKIQLATGLPMTLRFMTMEVPIFDAWGTDGSEPIIFLPSRGQSEERRNELKSVIESYLETPFSALGITNYDFEDNRNLVYANYHREIILYMPEYIIKEDEPRNLYGVIEQFWIQQGTQMRIYYETNRGTFWVTLALLAVGTLFIGNTTYVSTVGRTKDFATLKSLGWRRATVFRVSFTETLLISIIAGGITAVVLAGVWLFSDRHLEPWVLLLTAPAVILTFLLGSFLPILRMIIIKPLQGLKQGEVRKFQTSWGSGTFGYLIRSLIFRPGRTLVTILAMIIPGTSFAFIYFIYFGVQALYGETLMGEHLAIELRLDHFVLNALVFAVAGLAVADTLLINLRERQKEFGLLKAVGWRNNMVASLLVWEGATLGLLGGIIGTVIAVNTYTHIFAIPPQNAWLNGAILSLVPAIVGGIAGVIPALRALRLPAAQAINED